jgi:serine phosphatase RsbU (regulator of sigma subunit)
LAQDGVVHAAPPMPQNDAMTESPKKDITIQDFTLIVAPDDATAPGEERIHQLLVTEGAEQGRMIELAEPSITVGRAAPADVTLRDVEISRSHCRITQDAGVLMIADLNSTNGTYVDGRRITAPVKLTDGCMIRVGRHQLKYERRTRREIELSQDFERSLEGASRYVQSMLPPPIINGPVRTEWLLIPCARLGGDALGYQWIDDDHFSLYLLDVSGHGPEAAMLAVGVMNALRQKALPGADLRDAAQVTKQLNAMFQMEHHSLMYFTLWYGVYQMSSRTLSYCSAGQHPAYLVPTGASEPQALRTANPPVGVTPAHAFKAASTTVPKDATLYLFSDGVFEIDTVAGQRWELEDLLPTLLEVGAPDLAETQRIYQSVQKVARRGPFEDDFSVLVTTFN